jgi:hypothetical protein
MIDLPNKTLKSRNLAQIITFRAEIGPVDEILNAINSIYSESAHQELSESVKISIVGQDPP